MLSAVFRYVEMIVRTFSTGTSTLSHRINRDTHITGVVRWCGMLPQLSQPRYTSRHERQMVRIGRNALPTSVIWIDPTSIHQAMTQPTNTCKRNLSL
jgi:hypothetical protein